ncbi:hypothetical protein KDX08_27060 [Burkholderia cenocepacia]|uniref:hypothetical protein n=1 Tax=Burkholderia cenocepacia TaxID=95486 RepID=UPI0012AED349|nr:hypothetical protein [Burkholderia cenocepacia]MBR7996114.1 hypothetical protein [Burkholderia cenocepacia]
MQITKVFSFLTYPGRKRDDVADAAGTAVPVVEGKLCGMLDGIYTGAEEECDIPIMFTPDADKQHNDVRAEIMRVVDDRTLESAAFLANRLQRATGGQSGMALFFVCLGPDQDRKIVLARFPADEGIVAEKAHGALTVAFVEQVFLKSALSYKAVVYNDADGGDDFWSGRAIDRQINSGAKTVADYWIVDFLRSNFRSTSALGTKRLAMALRNAVASTASADVRREISMAVQLAQNLDARNVLTIPDFCDRLNLSRASKDAVVAAVIPARILNDKFRFDRAEFDKHVAYRSIELDNGAVLSAQIGKFDDCFESIASDEDPEVVTYSTSGRVIDEKLRKSK